MNYKKTKQFIRTTLGCDCVASRELQRQLYQLYDELNNVVDFLTCTSPLLYRKKQRYALEYGIQQLEALYASGSLRVKVEIEYLLTQYESMVKMVS